MSGDWINYQDSVLTEYDSQIAAGKYDNLLRALNSGEIWISQMSAYLTNESLMLFILEKITPKDLNYLVFLYSFLKADLQVILHGLELVFQAAQKRNIDLFSSEDEYYIGEIVCDIITEQLPIRNDIFGLMFRYGLDPNSEIGGKLFYLFALQYRDYSTMELLMHTPGFSLTPELLSEFNKEVDAIDRLREQMIARLNPGRQPLKRSRYELD